MYFNMFGTDMVVLNSSESIADLLDKRSAIYSDKVTAMYNTYPVEANARTPLLVIAPVTNCGIDRPG